MSDDEDEEPEEEDLGIGPVSIHSIAMARTRTADRGSRPKTEVGKFAGVELTSIINMMDLENSDGAKPLVDLDAGPRLDSGPRLLDSGPSMLPTPTPNFPSRKNAMKASHESSATNATAA